MFVYVKSDYLEKNEFWADFNDIWTMCDAVVFAHCVLDIFFCTDGCTFAINHLLSAGPDSNIGKLGTCLGRQLNRGSTHNRKKIGKNCINPLHSHLIPYIGLFGIKIMGISFPFTLQC